MCTLYIFLVLTSPAIMSAAGMDRFDGCFPSCYVETGRRSRQIGFMGPISRGGRMVSDREAGRFMAKTAAGGTVPRLYQQVFDIVAGQIMQGVLQEGTRLSESAVAEQFGI